MDIRKVVNSGEIIELKGMDIRQGGEFCENDKKNSPKTHLMGVG